MKPSGHAPQAADGGETWHVRQGQAARLRHCRAIRRTAAATGGTFGRDRHRPYGCAPSQVQSCGHGHGQGGVIGGEELRTVALDEADGHAPQDAPQDAQGRRARRPTAQARPMKPTNGHGRATGHGRDTSGRDRPSGCGIAGLSDGRQRPRRQGQAERRRVAQGGEGLQTFAPDEAERLRTARTRHRPHRSAGHGDLRTAQAEQHGRATGHGNRQTKRGESRKMAYNENSRKRDVVYPWYCLPQLDTKNGTKTE